jgi:23S rRNA (pseudouridine1915-N3)-methyltransferase
MKLHIAAIGKPRAGWAVAALDHYQKFLKKYGGAEFHFVPAMRITGGASAEKIPAGETARLIAAVPERSTRIFLDRTGRLFDSEQWAAQVGRIRQDSRGPVAFLVGGPLGLDISQKRPGDLIWSLSALTFPHEMALVILCEQLARGLSILRGDDYHN